MAKYPPIKDQFLYLFSSSELIISYLVIFYALYNFNLYAGLLVLIILGKIVFLHTIKTRLKGSTIGDRPKKAFNCNMFSGGGKTHTGGFPSGHMVLLGLLSFIVYNLYEVNRNQNIILLYSIIVITTFVGRIYTNCHTVIQCIGGLLIGFGIGYLLYYGDNYLKVNYKTYNEHRTEFYQDLYFLT